MKNVNWDEVQETSNRPVPGGYIVGITNVEDNEEKEYLKIEWEFYDGPYKGSNQDTFDAHGFWPMPMICSYKKKALPFFKGFKTSVEMSNRNYTFRNDPQSLLGKFVGVILGEEEYMGNDGTVKKRLYVAEKRSCQAIQKNDFKIPELKKLNADSRKTTSNSPVYNQPSFGPVTDDDPNLPF